MLSTSHEFSSKAKQPDDFLGNLKKSGKFLIFLNKCKWTLPNEQFYDPSVVFCAGRILIASLMYLITVSD